MLSPVLPSSASSPSFAVVFKTHAWDPFIARQFDRYAERIGRGHLFAFLDETSGALGAVDHDRVVRATNRDLIASGLTDRAERGSLIWWNTDYPNHYFTGLFPDYDYYVFAEYDTCINRDLDGFIDDVAAAAADLVTLPNRCPKADWVWTRYHLATYSLDALEGSLNCLSVYSHRAAHRLRQRRIEMSRQSERGEIAFWPGNEVFIATETRLAGYKSMSLQDFGSIDGYEWYPPHLEDDLDQVAGMTFLHPVLDRGRYMASLMKFSSLAAYWHPASRLGRALKRFPEYRPQMPAAFRRRLAMRARERGQDLWVRLRPVRPKLVA